MSTDLTYAASLAIVTASGHYKVPPEQTATCGGKARYMSFRLLKEAYPDHSVSLLARCVGYSHSSSQVITAPSQEANYKFDRKLLLQLWEIYKERLEKMQNFA